MIDFLTTICYNVLNKNFRTRGKTMKKIVLFLIAMLLVLQATACNTQTTNNSENNNQTTETVEQSVENVEQIEDDGLATIQTKHFSVKVPKEWEEICSYEIEEMSITFIHKKSNEYFQKNYGYSGGYLFSISIENLSHYSDVEAEILGGLGIPGLGEFNVWLQGACDVEAEADTREEYQKCWIERENIASTLSFNDGYYFSKTPYKIEGNEYYTQNYEQPQVQYSQQPQQNNSYNSSQNQNENILSDSKIKSIAENYCRNELKRELLPKAAATVGLSEIISRSKHTANVRCRFNYNDGVNKFGKLYVVIIVDVYTGEILSFNIQ